METYKIEYNGKDYKFQEVYHNGCGCNVIIADEALADAILDENDNPKGEYEERLDDKIYGYVPEEMFDMGTYALTKYVNEVFD